MSSLSTCGGFGSHGDATLTAICRILVGTICVDGKCLTLTQAIKHSVVKWMIVLDMYTSHIVFGIIRTHVIDVTATTCFQRCGDVCGIIYHLQEEIQISRLSTEALQATMVGAVQK